jgi:hypothetical protein
VYMVVMIASSPSREEKLTSSQDGKSSNFPDSSFRVGTGRVAQLPSFALPYVPDDSPSLPRPFDVRNVVNSNWHHKLRCFPCVIMKLKIKAQWQ